LAIALQNISAKEETGDEVILMKNQKGEVIGFEKLNYRISENRNLKISLETAIPV